jgi:methylamine dehydrogenase accessory protein MauD
MNTALLIVCVALCLLVLCLGFLVLGTLRALGLLTWRVEQLETVTPSRIGRDGLKVGKKAPDFALPAASNGPVSLYNFAGRKVLLVFTQSGCGPCGEIIPELNRIQDEGEYQVLVVNNGVLDETRIWAVKVHARFPILAQEKYSVSKRFEVFVTPFAFLIDEQGVIASKGIAGSREYLTYVLTGAGNRKQYDRVSSECDSTVEHDSAVALSSKEVSHV